MSRNRYVCTEMTNEQNTIMNLAAIVPEIHNVVATIQIECEPIDIHRLSILLPYSTYDKSKFAAITIRLLEPTCTCLLFTSGKLVVTGAGSWEEALYTAYHVRDILKETHPGQSFEIVAYDVQNIVAHAEMGKGLFPPGGGDGSSTTSPPSSSLPAVMDLDAFYRDHFEECTYQRSMFPGLIYRPLSASVVLLCFSSAKVVITGGKSANQIFSEWERLVPVVARYVRPA